MSECPKCQSSDARYLSVIHKEGLSRIDTQSRSGCNPFALLLFPLIGVYSLFFVGSRRLKTEGTQQSILSAESAPPTRKPLIGSVLWALVGLLLMTNHAVFIGLVILIIAGLAGYAAYQYNNQKFPAEYALWQNSLMCSKCGTVYATKLVAPATSAQTTL